MQMSQYIRVPGAREKGLESANKIPFIKKINRKHPFPNGLRLFSMIILIAVWKATLT